MFSNITNFFGILKPSQNTYHTDIINLTCSCEDWKQKRQHYPSDDPRRLCKHIVKNLDTNNLPSSMKYYKETIQYYQDNEKGFNKFDFDKIISLVNNDLIILGSDENIYENWMNVYDEAGNQYGFFASEWGGFTWAKDKKPNGYEEVEEYFSKPSMQLPIRLQAEEKEDLIQFIKEKIPSKQHYYLEIVNGQSIATIDGIDYFLMESKISKSEEQRLLKEFQKNKYSDKYESYRLVSEAKMVPYDPATKVFQIIVKNNEIIIEIITGISYSYRRDYDKAKIFAGKKRLVEENFLLQQEQVWNDELALKAKQAEQKGYLLSSYLTTGCYGCSGSEIVINSDKDRILRLYNRTSVLLQEKNISVKVFNQVLAEIGFIKKIDNLNNFNWILIGSGLNYGINFVQVYSQYTHGSIPDWYIMVTFDNKTSSLQKETRQGFMNMTTILWKKEKFHELLDLVITNLEMIKEKTKKKVTTNTSRTSQKQAEREEWLQFIECPHCASKNIHKKNKRKYGYGEVQRYQCMDCKKIFQEVLSNE